MIYMYQNKIDRQKLDPYAPSRSRNCKNVRVLAYLRHGKPGKVWNIVQVFLRPIFVRPIFTRRFSARTKKCNEYEARRERAAARNRYGGDLRSFHFLMSPPKSDFEPISGAVYGVSGFESALRPRVFFWLFGWITNYCMCAKVSEAANLAVVPIENTTTLLYLKGEGNLIYYMMRFPYGCRLGHVLSV